MAEFKSQFGDKFGIIRLGIFGSVAREENNENSDIDIVVEVKKPSLTIMYELEQSLKALFGCDLIHASKGDGAIYKARFFGISQVQQIGGIA